MHPEANKKTFIEALQLLDDSTKRKILFVTTGVAMVVVVGIWFTYFNGLVATTSQSNISDNGSNADSGQVATGQAVAVVTQPSANIQTGQGIDQVSAWENIKIQMANIGIGFEGAMRWLVKTIQGPGQYTISPSGS